MPKQKALPVTSEQEDAFFDTWLPLDDQEADTQTVRVRFDTDVAQLASQIHQGLCKARGVKPASSVNGFDPLVKDLVEVSQKWMSKTQSEGGDDGEIPQGAVRIPVARMRVNTNTAIEIVQHAMQRWERDSFEDALKVAMLHDNFQTRMVQGGMVISFAFDKDGDFGGVPEDVWVRDEEWFAARLLETHAHPGFTPSISEPAEIRAQMVIALMQENPMLALRINELFQTAFVLVAQVAYGDELDENTVDRLGFRATGMGGNMDERRKRRAARRAAARVQQSGGDEADNGAE